MKQYFTALEFTSEGFVGVVFDPNTNQPVHKTEPQESQVEASRLVAEFLKNSEQPLHLTEDRPNNIVSTTPPPKRRRCCGQQ